MLHITWEEALALPSYIPLEELFTMSHNAFELMSDPIGVQGIVPVRSAQLDGI